MSDDRKIVSTDPENSETPLIAMGSWVTPTRQFFVRNHFDVPQIDLATWRLEICGCVEKPLTLTWEELSKLPRRRVPATMECAGNGRSFLREKRHGVQWGAGAVGHAEWTGVSLKLILEKVGIKPEACEVLCAGADRGTEHDHPESMPFARSLPLKKALHKDTLLATHMNGAPLKPNHGFPLRLFVPGWYGVASVKWLERIELLDRPYTGYFQTKKYTTKVPSTGGPKMSSVGPMPVKSQIVRPCNGDTLGVGSVRIFGLAWAGEETVESVEVSLDAGATWEAGRLVNRSVPYSWCPWEFIWEVSQAGPHTILSRARSKSGRVQPEGHDPNSGGYLINFSQPLEVTVDASKSSKEATTDVDALLYDMNAFAEANSKLPLDVDLEFMAGEGI